MTTLSASLTIELMRGILAEILYTKKTAEALQAANCEAREFCRRHQHLAEHDPEEFQRRLDRLKARQDAALRRMGVRT